MDAKTRSALNQINRDFYAQEAKAFSDTRDHPWPGWDRLLPRLRETAPLSLLDVGCGNGRFARFLERNGIECHYTGIDSSRPLLDLAARVLPSAAFFEHDLIDDPPDELPAGPFDWITLFGVTHHIPGEANRQELLSELAARLGEAGHLVFTTWQFGQDPRFSTRLRPIEGVDKSQLEAGDHLIQWGTEPSTTRYCHAMTRNERTQLTEGLALELVEEFESDGKSGSLNHYSVCRRRP